MHNVGFRVLRINFFGKSPFLLLCSTGLIEGSYRTEVSASFKLSGVYIEPLIRLWWMMLARRIFLDFRNLGFWGLSVTLPPPYHMRTSFSKPRLRRDFQPSASVTRASSVIEGYLRCSPFHVSTSFPRRQTTASEMCLQVMPYR